MSLFGGGMAEVTADWIERIWASNPGFIAVPLTVLLVVGIAGGWWYLNRKPKG